MSIMTNAAFYSEKVVPSAQIKHHLQDKTKMSKQICEWILMWEDNSKWTFSLEEALLWTRVLAGSSWNSLMMDLFLTNTPLYTS